MTAILPVNTTTPVPARHVDESFTSGSVVAVSGVYAVDIEVAHRTVPLTIPRDQLYYWTGLWQDGVKVAREALDRGDYEEFDSDDPNDVVRWLLDPEEDC